MCGIFGMYSGDPLSRARMRHLVDVASSQVCRGRDAFGLAWRDETGRVSAFKRAGSVDDHADELRRGLGSLGLIGHTRWTTHGSAERNMNNHPHPFRYEDEICQVVHNGVIGNYLDIARQRGLRLRTECDSEVLARHVETNDGTLLERVRDAVADVEPCAPFAAAFLVPSGLVLARRGNPLYWSEHRGVSWFASTHSALPGRLHVVPDDSAYLIPFGNGPVESISLRARVRSNARYLGSDVFA